MEVAVVVPWRAGCPHREAAFQWVTERLPWPVVTGSCPDGPWVKAAAIDEAISKTSADVLIVHDADVWCAGLAEALRRIDERPVVIPHSRVLRLTAAGTDQFMAGERWPQIEEEHRGQAGGGIVILRRDIWEQVPMDPRFIGWGQEDRSWAFALETMTGKICRFTFPLHHLWHPPQQRLSRATGSEANRSLEARYEGAWRHPELMAPLLAEARTEFGRHRWRSSLRTTSKPASAGT